MAIGFALAAFAAGTYSAYNKRRGLYGNANERDRSAKESLLTAKFNIKQRTIEGRQTQFQVLETGGNLVRQIAIEGKRAEGAATVAGATSGAVVESGSSRAVLANIAQEAVSAQTDAIIATKNRIRAEARVITNKNTSEWRNAKLNQRQQNRIANRERKSADKQFTADMLKTGVSSIGAYNTASAFSKKTEPTKTVAGTKVNTARHAFASKPSHVPKGPTSNYSGMGKGWSEGRKLGREAQRFGRGGKSRDWSARWEQNWASNPGSKRVIGYTTNRGKRRW